MRKLTTLLISPLAFLLAACTGIPQGIEAVSDFRLERYLGKWYEIARLDHSFERGLSDVIGGLCTARRRRCFGT